MGALLLSIFQKNKLKFIKMKKIVKGHISSE